MQLSPQDRAAWEHAQQAEKGHWAWLWLPESSNERRGVVNGEIIKGEFIFQQTTDYFGVHPKKDWADARILDVGCGPVSLVARHEYGKKRAGIDPLDYPSWVYEDYDKQGFTVFKQPFEEIDTSSKYDVIIFYNALQHFANLEMVAQQCKRLLAKNGAVYLSEYLEIPTDSAHIQYLQANLLDMIFRVNGFNVESAKRAVLLPGYIELWGGLPASLYVARLTHTVKKGRQAK